MEVHGVVVVYVPSFIFRVVGVRVRVRVGVIFLARSLCAGVTPKYSTKYIGYLDYLVTE